MERGVGELALLALLAFPDERDFVAGGRVLVAVEAIVDDVDLRSGKPFVKRLLRLVEDRGPLAEPFEIARLVFPEAGQVFGGLFGEGVLIGHICLPHHIL